MFEILFILVWTVAIAIYENVQKRRANNEYGRRKNAHI